MSNAILDGGGLGNQIAPHTRAAPATTDQLKSYVVETGKIPGEGLARRSQLVKNGPLVAQHFTGVATMYDMFVRGVRLSTDRPCLGTREKVGEAYGKYIWDTYATVQMRMTNVGSAFVGLGLSPGDYVGIFAKNSAEWIITEQACYAYSLSLVTLYDTLGEEATDHIVQQTELRVLVCEAAVVKKVLPKSALNIKHIVLCDVSEVPAEIKALCAECNIQAHTLGALEILGEANRKPHVPPKPADVATICYTSGTTGVPKGAVLTHGNLVADISAMQLLAENKKFYQITSKDCHCSYLPLAHVFERLIANGILAAGARIGFYQGNVLKLTEDLAVLRPTIFPSVPRLFNRIYDKILATVAALPEGKRNLVEKALAKKKHNMVTKGTLSHFLYDTLVFKKMKARLGGRVRAMVTGAAPISGDVIQFLRVVFGCEVFEGYGQTETSAGSTLSLMGDYSVNHVGAPFPCNEIKLVDVPEMNYTSASTPEQGEICFRGPNIFIGYLKMPEKTAEALDADGWLHSGDIGQWQPDGTLKIIDRKKNIFKLAQGEYVAPEKIELVYQKSPYVAQAYVHGDSLEAKLVGVIVPDEETLKPWCDANGVAATDFASVVRNPKVKELIAQSINECATQSKLKGFEKIAEFHLESTLFSVENDLLTPTFKLKRQDAKKHYAAQIAEMYAKINGK